MTDTPISHFSCPFTFVFIVALDSLYVETEMVSKGQLERKLVELEFPKPDYLCQCSDKD